MIGEHDDEPVRGLPGALPPGERLIWQGSPDWKRLALTAFHVRGVTVYFVLLALWSAASGGGIAGVMTTAAAAGCAVGLLCLMAWASARTTVYSLTSRRIVLRVGIALSKCVNIPLALVDTARLNMRADGSGDIALALKDEARIGYALIWPHARPWMFARTEPMLRALAEVQPVATLVADELLAVQPHGRKQPVRIAEPAPGRLASVREAAA